MFSFRSKGVLRLLCLLVAAAALLAGCAGEPTPADDRPETSASDAAEPSAGEVGAGEPESGSAAETAFSYNAHWRSDVLSDLVTPSEWESVHHMVDAIYAGEDTFESASEEAYRFSLWSIDSFLPMSYRYLMYAPTVPDDCFADGVGHIYYTGSKEEYLAEEKKVEDDVMAVVNSVVKPEYTDFEKALALYLYFADNYVYDHDLEHNNTDANKLTALHVLYEKRGICQEISQAYSFLLTQAGVDATVMSGIRAYDQAPHRWSYIRLNGRNYHIDPTYVLGTHDLSFFLMTDEERAAEDDYPIQDHVITSTFTQSHDHPVYKADDETFSALWMKTYASIDTENKLLTYYTTDENFIVQYDTFSYAGY